MSYLQLLTNNWCRKDAWDRNFLIAIAFTLAGYAFDKFYDRPANEIKDMLFFFSVWIVLNQYNTMNNLKKLVDTKEEVDQDQQ